ncbi:MAG TPA: helicase-associated domain-containing protein [Thermoanaerobaculia bacterium]|nr:helicase-associated domain-containing protein [Thermoanaerobaculia bacterium]
MKHFGIDWGAFLGGLEVWGRQSPADRRVFLDHFVPNQPVKRSDLLGAAPALLRSGLAVPVGDGRRVQAAKPFLPLLRGLRAMDHLQPFEQPSPALLEAYLDVHFSMQECGRLLAADGVRYVTHPLTADRVASVEWMEGFRQARDPLAWEKERAAGAGSTRGTGGAGILCFAEPPVAPALRAVIDRLLTGGSPCLLEDLVRALPNLPRAVLGKALYAGIRYLLLFPALRTADLAPVIGLWPPLVQRLTRSAISPPLPVEPEETCPTGFAFEDLVTVLAACTAEPPRLRSNDLTLFARARDSLTELLPPLPAWLDGHRAGRVERSAWTLRRLGFAEITSDDQERPQLTATPEGRRWLERSAKERLKSVLDDLKQPARRFVDGPGFNFLSYEWTPYSSRDIDEKAAVVAAFRDLPRGVFFGVADFLRHRSESRNPLAELSRNNRRYAWMRQDSAQLARTWARRLLGFLQERLVLLGAVQLGRIGEQSCFALTDVGLYLLDLADDFEAAAEHPAEVVVQPNFDVVFLSPSITTEAAIARFAERRGTGVGTLFRITKRAVLGAAATGLTPEQAIGTLRQAASKGVPDNVLREITGWFGQTRRITVRPAILVHCPDVEAARRVLAAGGKSVAPLTDTVVELKEPKGKAALLRKLREVGVFVRE